MKSYGRSKRLKRDKWANRMAIMGITLVVLCLAVAINAKGSGLRKADLEYQIRESELAVQVKEEEDRTKDLQEYKSYVNTKQYAGEVAKEKLGLVNPDEILLKPTD
jgi:cell division protein DivIC